jgi:hypothetical protein
MYPTPWMDHREVIRSCIVIITYVTKYAVYIPEFYLNNICNYNLQNVQYLSQQENELKLFPHLSD